jgi:hypothetical protein
MSGKSKYNFLFNETFHIVLIRYISVQYFAHYHILYIFHSDFLFYYYDIQTTKKIKTYNKNIYKS